MVLNLSVYFQSVRSVSEASRPWCLNKCACLIDLKVWRWIGHWSNLWTFEELTLLPTDLEEVGVLLYIVSLRI